MMFIPPPPSSRQVGRKLGKLLATMRKLQTSAKPHPATPHHNMSTTTQRPTPETDAAIISANGAWTFELKETMQRLERERDEALAKLSTVYRWIERNHPDGFIDSQSHLQNLDRVADAWHDKLHAMREAIREAHEALDNCIEFINDAQIIEAQWHWEPVKQSKAALAKLQPFIKP